MIHLYDLISRIKAAETDADSVAILEEELIRFIEEAKQNSTIYSSDGIYLSAYMEAINKFESNLLRLLTKEK